MKTRIAAIALAGTLMSFGAMADHDNDTVDAAIGGGLGGAAGAAIGNEVGGSTGAILGGALGGAGGAAVATDRDDGHHHDGHHGQRYDRGSSKGCPPGLAKQGRC